jgi:hypothetical protein
MDGVDGADVVVAGADQVGADAAVVGEGGQRGPVAGDGLMSFRAFEGLAQAPRPPTNLPSCPVVGSDSRMLSLTRSSLHTHRIDARCAGGCGGASPRGLVCWPSITRRHCELPPKLGRAGDAAPRAVAWPDPSTHVQARGWGLPLAIDYRASPPASAAGLTGAKGAGAVPDHGQHAEGREAGDE